MNWNKSNGARLNSKLTAFLNELSSRTNVPIYVTSGERTPEEQVSVVCNNTIKQNGRNLNVYNDPKERELYEVECQIGGDRSKIVNYLKSRGPKSHGTGNCLDLSVHDLSESEISELMTSIKDIGGYPLREHHPPHIHIKINSSGLRLNSGSLAAGIAAGDITIKSALDMIFQDGENCKITQDHINAIKKKLKNNEFLIEVLQGLLKFFGLEDISKNIDLEEIINKILDRSTDKDYEDLIKYIISEDAEKLFEGLCTPDKRDNKVLNVGSGKIDFKERYNDYFLDDFYRATSIKESNENHDAFGRDGEISSVQMMFFNAINWFGEERVFELVKKEKGPTKEARLRAIYNKYRNREGRTKDESVEAGRILQGLSIYTEKNVEKVCKQKMQEYFNESQDFFKVACKWNTGKAEIPCSRNEDYPKDVLGIMYGLIHKSSNYNSLGIKKIAHYTMQTINKEALSLDLKGKHLDSKKLNNAVLKLFKII